MATRQLGLSLKQAGILLAERTDVRQIIDQQLSPATRCIREFMTAHRPRSTLRTSGHHVRNARLTPAPRVPAARQRLRHQRHAGRASATPSPSPLRVQVALSSGRKTV
jgi:hypothetical protein